MPTDSQCFMERVGGNTSDSHSHHNASHQHFLFTINDINYLSNKKSLSSTRCAFGSSMHCAIFTFEISGNCKKHSNRAKLGRRHPLARTPWVSSRLFFPQEDLCHLLANLGNFTDKSLETTRFILPRGQSRQRERQRPLSSFFTFTVPGPVGLISSSQRRSG